MEPIVMGFIATVAIVSVTVLKIARLRAARSAEPSADVSARLEALERGLQSLQEELAETQERLDFAERLLSKGRSEGLSRSS